MAYTLNDDYVDLYDTSDLVPDTSTDPIAVDENPIDSDDTYLENEDYDTVVDPGTNLSVTAFTNGPDDKLKVVDAYGKRGTGTNNSLEGSFKSSSSLFGAMSIGNANVSAIISKGNISALLGKSGLTLASLNTKNLINSIGNQFPGTLKSSFSLMSNNMLASMNIVKSAQGTSININGIMQTVNNQTVPPDANDINAISGTLSYLTANVKISNVNSKNVTNISIGLVNTSTQYGLSNVFSTLSVSATSGNGILTTSIMGNVAVGLVPGIINNSSISLLAEITTANNGSYVPLISGSNSDLIKQFSQNYKIPKGRANSDLIKDWNSLVSSFNSIDPNWLTYNRNGINIINAEKITFFSSDLIKVMKMAYATLSPIIPNINTLNLASPYSIPDANYRLLLLATDNEPADALIAIKSSFPNLYIDSSINRQFV